MCADNHRGWNEGHKGLCSNKPTTALRFILQKSECNIAKNFDMGEYDEKDFEICPISSCRRRRIVNVAQLIGYMDKDVRDIRPGKAGEKNALSWCYEQENIVGRTSWRPRTAHG